MPYELTGQASKEDKERRQKQCWHTGCKNICKIENISGYRYCIKHFFWYKKHDPSVFNNKRRIIWKNLLK